MGPKRGHVEIYPLVEDDNAEISPPSILKERKIGDEYFSEPEGKFSVSDPGDENLDPQVVPETPPPGVPQSQPQQSEGNLSEERLSLTYISVAEYHDPSITRWISSDSYVGRISPLTQDFLYTSFRQHSKPVLPRTYIEFERRYQDLRNLALQWAELFFAPDPVMPRMTGAQVKKFGGGHPLLVRWIDRVANAHGLCWLDLLHEKRHLIAMAVLGKVLEDRVFKSEYFGAPEEEKKLLRAIDQVVEAREVDDIINMKNQDFLSDAFARQRPRATYINQSLDESLQLPERFAAEVDRLYKQLVILLRPLVPTNEKQFPEEEYYDMLDWIVALAGRLSLDMRREPDTVYYVAITPPRHKGLDLERMSPVIFRHEEAAHIAASSNEITSVISVWPGVVAYRRLSPREFSSRTICEALIFTSLIKDKEHPQGTESNPEWTCNEPQFWQYLKFLGVPINPKGRACYS